MWSWAGPLLAAGRSLQPAPSAQGACEWVQGLWQDWQCPGWAAGGAEAMRLPPWERVQTLRGGAGRGTLGGGWLSVVRLMPVLRSSELLQVSSAGLTP